GSGPRRAVVDSLHAEPVEPRGVALGDPPPLVRRDAVQDPFKDRAGAREGRLRVGIVRTPHELVDADQRAVADTEVIFLEAHEHVAVEEVARQGATRVAVPALAAGA